MPMTNRKPSISPLLLYTQVRAAAVATVLNAPPLRLDGFKTIRTDRPTISLHSSLYKRVARDNRIDGRFSIDAVLQLRLNTPCIVYDARIWRKLGVY